MTAPALQQAQPREREVVGDSHSIPCAWCGQPAVTDLWEMGLTSGDTIECCRCGGTMSVSDSYSTLTVVAKPAQPPPPEEAEEDADEEEEEAPQPIGTCSGCNSPVYIEGGFCGVCHPRFL